MATISNPQVFEELAGKIHHLFIRYGVVDLGEIVNFDNLFSRGMERAREYSTLLGQYLAALTTYVERKGIDTLMVLNGQNISPIGVLTLPQIMEEHNATNPSSPVRNVLVYNALDLAGIDTEKKFHGYVIPHDLGDKRILILSHGGSRFDGIDVISAVVDLQRVNRVYAGNKPGNLVGILQVAEQNEDVAKFLQEKSKEVLGYPVSYHRILPAPAFNLPMPEVK